MRDVESCALSAPTEPAMMTVGRDLEQDAIDLLCAQDAEGALLLIGERGSGKTHVLQQAANRSSIRTLLLRTSQAESRWPLSGMRSLLALVTGDSETEPLAMDSEWPSDPHRASVVAGETLEYLRALRLAPTLLLVDDVQLLDHESLLLLSFILTRLHGTNLRIVATLAAEYPMPLLDHVPRLRLRSLDRNEVVALALVSPRHRLAESSAVILAEYAGGNPAVLLDLIDRLDPLERSGAVPLHLPPRAGVIADELGAKHLEGLQTEARELLDEIASAPITRRGSITRWEPPREDVLEELLAAGIAEQRGHYVHIREGVVRMHLELTGTARTSRERHQAAAADDAADVRMRAWHTSFVVPDPAVALRLLEVAATLVREGAFGAGIECAERARVVAEGEPFGADGFIELASALIASGEIVLAGRYIDLARQAATTPRAQVRVADLRQKAEFLRHQRVVDLDVRLSAWITADPERSAELIASTAINHALRFETALAEETLARMAGVDAHRRAPHELRAVAILGAVTGAEVDDLAEPLTPQAELLDVLVASRVALIQGRSPRAKELCRAVLDRRPIEPIWSCMAQHTLVEAEIAEGRLSNARRIAQSMGRVPSGVARRANPTALDAWLWLADDELEEASAAIAALLDPGHQGQNPAVSASLLVLQGKLALLAGDHEQAMFSLAKADAIDRELENPGLVRHLPDFVDAAVQSGRRGEIEQSVRRFEARASRISSRWARLAVMRISATLAEPIAAIEALDELVAIWTPDDSPFELGSIHVLRAERLDACGQRAAAKRALASACDAFDESGAVAWARNARRRLETLDAAGDVSPLHGTGLTAEELLIVDAIQEGRHTKEIAGLLHLSVRAVELRLTSIYRAAGVHSRTELVQRLRPEASYGSHT